MNSYSWFVTFACTCSHENILVLTHLKLSTGAPILMTKDILVLTTTTFVLVLIPRVEFNFAPGRGWGNGPELKIVLLDKIRGLLVLLKGDF